MRRRVPLTGALPCSTAASVPLQAAAVGRKAQQQLQVHAERQAARVLCSKGMAAWRGYCSLRQAVAEMRQQADAVFLHSRLQVWAEHASEARQHAQVSLSLPTIAYSTCRHHMF